MKTNINKIVLAAALLVFTPAVNAQHINFGPAISGNPLSLSGTHLGVGWELEVGTLNPGYGTAPSTTGGGLVYWNYGSQNPTPNTNAYQEITFTLSFNEAVNDLSFDLFSFGNLSINLGPSLTDTSGGEQVFTFSALNGATPVVFSASDIMSGSLTNISGFGTTTLTGVAGVYDAGGVDNEGEALRLVNFHLDSPVTSIQFHFTSESFGNYLPGDTIDLRNFTFTPVPEPSSALLVGLGGSLALLRRRRTS